MHANYNILSGTGLPDRLQWTFAQPGKKKGRETWQNIQLLEHSVLKPVNSRAAAKQLKHFLKSES